MHIQQHEVYYVHYILEQRKKVQVGNDQEKAQSEKCITGITYCS